MTVSAFKEDVPGEIAGKVRASVGAEEQVLMQVATDMAERASFGKRFLVVTDQRLLVLDSATDDVDIPLTQIERVRSDALIGGGCLEVELREGAPVRVGEDGLGAAQEPLEGAVPVRAHGRKVPRSRASAIAWANRRCPSAFRWLS